MHVFGEKNAPTLHAWRVPLTTRKIISLTVCGWFHSSHMFAKFRLDECSRFGEKYVGQTDHEGFVLQNTLTTNERNECKIFSKLIDTMSA